jgi:hypothetical protein
MIFCGRVLSDNPDNIFPVKKLTGIDLPLIVQITFF